MKTFKQLFEQTDHVEHSLDIDANGKDPEKRKAGIENYLKKHAGNSITVTHHHIGKGGGGVDNVGIKGSVEHVMKAHNMMNYDEYPHTHAGYKQMRKDYGRD